MTIKIIETEFEYGQYLTRIEEIFDAPTGSAEAKELDLLVLLVNKHEEDYYPIDEPAPIEYIKVRME